MVHEPITITTMGAERKAITGTVLNASGTGLGLAVSEPVEPGTAVRIDLGEVLLLGEIVYCQPAKGAWAIGLELDQVLVASNELATLAREILNQDRLSAATPERK